MNYSQFQTSATLHILLMYSTVHDWCRRIYMYIWTSSIVHKTGYRNKGCVRTNHYTTYNVHVGVAKNMMTEKMISLYNISKHAYSVQRSYTLKNYLRYWNFVLEFIKKNYEWLMYSKTEIVVDLFRQLIIHFWCA